ncbi:MAG: Fur family transcriptional regulator [Hyphomicrobiaceae bacterium]
MRTETRPKQDAASFLPADHDHKRCTASLVERVSRVCEASNVRLTDLRRRVLEEIASSHKAVGAYDLIESMAARGVRLAPISVYRALEALAGVGAIHRIESRNAFFACHADHRGDDPRVILVCEDCLSVAEVASPATFGAIAEATERSGFTVKRRIVEVTGQCAACQGRTSAGTRP